MSVRMALAKLCACACGGALLGGGAVHVTERAQTKRVYATKVAKLSTRTITRRAVPHGVLALADVHRFRQVQAATPVRPMRHLARVRPAWRADVANL